MTKWQYSVFRESRIPGRKFKLFQQVKRCVFIHDYNQLSKLLNVYFQNSFWPEMLFEHFVLSTGQKIHEWIFAQSLLLKSVMFCSATKYLTRIRLLKIIVTHLYRINFCLMFSLIEPTFQSNISNHLFKIWKIWVETFFKKVSSIRAKLKQELIL